MIIGIKSNFDSLDLAEVCANKIRKNVSGSKSIKIVSKKLHNQEIPATYAFSARSENWVSTPLSILSVTRTNENLSTIPPRIIGNTEPLGGVRLEVICDEKQLNDIYKIMLSNGGLDIKKHY
jgi:hypothetical protein